MIIFGTLAVYGFMMAQSPPKLLANLTKLCRNDSYITLLNNCSNSLVHCISKSHGLNYIFKMKIFLFETTIPRVLIFGV